MIPVRRAVTREMADRDHRTGKPFVLRLVEGGRLVRIKVKGARTWFTVTVKQIWYLGAQNEVAERRARKKAEREARKREKQ
jgi:hypothetical protein